MRNFSFSIDAPPFSINSAYYLKSFKGSSPTKVRTKECREWGDKILVQLYRIKKDIEIFRAQFDDKNEAVSISLNFKIPKDKFYTKEGIISLRSNDLTNVEKLLVDILFDSRFNDRHLNDIKVINFNINDKLIVDLTSSKRPTDGDYRIDVNIGIISNKFEV